MTFHSLHKSVTFLICSVLYTALNAVYSSLACLTAAGHYSDCLKLVNDWMLTDGPTSDLHILRARLYKLLNQVSTAGPSGSLNA